LRKYIFLLFFLGGFDEKYMELVLHVLIPAVRLHGPTTVRWMFFLLKDNLGQQANVSS
jgi:hypothetical protein